MKFIYYSVCSIQELLSLIVITKLYIMTYFDAACIGNKITHQHLQKSRLTNTISTYDTYSLAALDMYMI